MASHHLASGTDAAAMALYDPAAARAALLACAEVGLDEVEAAAADGALLHWYTAADGSHAVRVYVDEAVPAGLRARARNGVAGLLLRAPGGRLAFSGIELLMDVGDDPETWPGGEPTLDLPPGDYVAEAFELGWDDASENAYDDQLAAAAGRGMVRASEALGVVTGLLVLVTLGLAIPGLVLLVARPAGFLALLPTWGLALAAAWALVIGAWRLPAMARVQAARERVDRDWPGAVVALRRLADGEPRPPAGGGFGEGVDLPRAS